LDGRKQKLFSFPAGWGGRGAGSRTRGAGSALPAVIWELGRALPSRSGASLAAREPRGDAEPQPAGLTGGRAGQAPSQGITGSRFWGASHPKPPPRRCRLCPGSPFIPRATGQARISSPGARGSHPCPALPGGARLELKHHPSLERQHVIPGRSVQLLREIPWDLD